MLLLRRQFPVRLRCARLAMLVATPLLLLGLLSQVGCSLFGYHGVEEWPSTTVLDEGRYEVRQYEPAAVAMTVVEPGVSNVGNEGFRRLAGYIFGGNEGDTSIAMTAPVVMEQDREGQDIAMTAPVVMEQTDAGWVMAFVLPKAYTAENAPKPNDDRVTITTDPGGLYAIYCFSGWFDRDDLATYTPRLMDWLQANGYRAIGDPHIAGYDPPWTLPWHRRNEVMVEVEAVGE
ncbi:heme-binding protein [Phycisphaeraceae bacterium D3-23]